MGWGNRAAPQAELMSGPGAAKAKVVVAAAASNSPSKKPNGAELLNGAEQHAKKPAAKSQATILIELAMVGVEYFHTPDCGVQQIACFFVGDENG